MLLLLLLLERATILFISWWDAHGDGAALFVANGRGDDDVIATNSTMPKAHDLQMGGTLFGGVNENISCTMQRASYAYCMLYVTTPNKKPRLPRNWPPDLNAQTDTSNVNEWRVLVLDEIIHLKLAALLPARVQWTGIVYGTIPGETETIYHRHNSRQWLRQTA